MFFFGLALGIVIATAVAYFRNKSFRAVVSADYTTFLAEIASIRSKALAGQALIAADFKKIEEAFSKVFSKL